MLSRRFTSGASVAGESWVLGHKEEIPSEGPAVDELERAVVALYVAAFEKQWDSLLDDIALAPLGDRDSTVQRLYALSSPQSPMRDLLVGIAHELTLTAPADTDKSSPAATVKPSAGGAAQRPLIAVQHLLGFGVA